MADNRLLPEIRHWDTGTFSGGLIEADNKFTATDTGQGDILSAYMSRGLRPKLKIRSTMVVFVN